MYGHARSRGGNGVHQAQGREMNRCREVFQ